jgi:hypothetical protein
VIPPSGQPLLGNVEQEYSVRTLGHLKSSLRKERGEAEDSEKNLHDDSKVAEQFTL